MLAQNLRINNIQLTDHMKLKKKEVQSVGASVFLRKGREYTRAITKTNCGAETEGMATQRLSYLGIHPVNSNQTGHYYS